MSAISPVDWCLLAVLALSIGIGIWRGLVYEVMSLVGWVVAYVAAMAFAPQLAHRLPIAEPGSALNHAAAVLFTFVMALLAWALLARLAQRAIAATPLSVIDRMLGAGFGLVRGLVILVIVATVVNLTPAGRSPGWQRSIGAQWLSVMLDGLRPVLPMPIARSLTTRTTARAP